jgi:hypothetical protein
LDCENIFRNIFNIFLILIKYFFHTLLFYTIKKIHIYLTCFTKYTMNNLPRNKIYIKQKNNHTLLCKKFFPLLFMVMPFSNLISIILRYGQWTRHFGHLTLRAMFIYSSISFSTYSKYSNNQLKILSHKQNKQFLTLVSLMIFIHIKLSSDIWYYIWTL